MDGRTVTFLYEASKILPQNKNGTIVCSHLIAKCHSFNEVFLPAQHFKSKVMCQCCGTQLSAHPLNVKVIPQPKVSRLAKRVLKKENFKNLTRYQYNFLKKIKKTYIQKYVATCTMCGKKTTELNVKSKLTLNQVHVTIPKLVFNKETEENEGKRKRETPKRKKRKRKRPKKKENKILKQTETDTSKDDKRLGQLVNLLNVNKSEYDPDIHVKFLLDAPLEL